MEAVAPADRPDQGSRMMHIVRPYLIAVLYVALATAVRVVLGLIWPDLSAFDVYYPAILIVTLEADVPAGVVAAILGSSVGWWLFVPPPYHFFPIPDATAANIILSFLISLVIVAAAAP